ncbi:MAG: amidohydrolase [Sulfolobales archaeon]|nr:amidohydrolase [Sulfolobales archaeon]MCX8208387.1 amidohydrolase [Sulfolobales archaeon]MDW8010719.1 amidohydrolase [Sulfolobales archaeon]
MSGALAVVARRIYTSFEPLKTVQAITIHGGRVIYAGSRDRAVKIAAELGGDVLEFRDEVVIPGLVDAHTHLESLGLALNSLDLRGTSSIEELKALVRAELARKTGWVFGRGWDQEKFREKRFPTRWDVDEVSKERPVLLVRVCGHMALLNTAAARELAIEEIAPRGVIRDESGAFTGLVVEEGVEVAMRRFWSGVDSETLEKYLLDSVEHAVSYGITTLGLAGASTRVATSLAKLSAEERLPAKVSIYLTLEAFKATAELGLRAPASFGRARLVGVKLFADGSLGARTAYLSEPYEDAADTRGIKLLGREEIAMLSSLARRLGYQVAIHAIGDAALDEVIEGLRGVGGRSRVEHLSVVRDDQLAKLGELGVVGVVQPHFIITDWWVLRRVGARRASWVYRFKDLGKFIQIALSTDSPVEPIDPWENIYAAVSRGEAEGIELARYSESQKLSVPEALHYYTYGSAYALGLENEVGRLEPGYSADFTVLDRNPLEVGVEELRKTKVLGVFVDGERVYPREVL